jgi:hypothetical protein
VTQYGNQSIGTIVIPARRRHRDCVKTQRLAPDHKTISDFRKNNATALRGVFKQFVLTCKELELFGNELVAIDSTKFTASNARDRVKDKKQLDKSIARINESIKDYLTQLDQNDHADENTGASVPLNKEALQKKIALLHQQKEHLEEACTELEPLKKRGSIPCEHKLDSRRSSKAERLTSKMLGSIPCEHKLGPT